MTVEITLTHLPLATSPYRYTVMRKRGETIRGQVDTFDQMMEDVTALCAEVMEPQEATHEPE